MGRKVKVKNYGLAVPFNPDLLKDDAYDLHRILFRKVAKAHQDRLDRMAWDVFKRVKKPEAPKWVLVGDAECIRETALALCIRVPRSYVNDPLMRLKTEIWVPKSQCHPTENEIGKQGDKGFLVIPEWLAKEKGL